LRSSGDLGQMDRHGLTVRAFPVGPWGLEAQIRTTPCFCCCPLLLRCHCVLSLGARRGFGQEEPDPQALTSARVTHSGSVAWPASLESRGMLYRGAVRDDSPSGCAELGAATCFELRHRFSSRLFFCGPRFRCVALSFGLAPPGPTYGLMAAFVARHPKISCRAGAPWRCFCPWVEWPPQAIMGWRGIDAEGTGRWAGNPPGSASGVWEVWPAGLGMGLLGAQLAGDCSYALAHAGLGGFGLGPYLFSLRRPRINPGGFYRGSGCPAAMPPGFTKPAPAFGQTRWEWP